MTDLDSPFFAAASSAATASALMPAKAENIRHNWLYSVVPGGTNYSIYLIAYCKNDRKYVTVKLHTDDLTDFVVEGNAAIPVWGCKPLEGT